MNVQVEFLNDPEPQHWVKRVLKWYWFHLKRCCWPYAGGTQTERLLSYIAVMVSTNVFFILFVLLLVAIEIGVKYGYTLFS